MANIDVIKAFDKAGALLKGHFSLSSGLHSGQYLQCALLLRYPQYAKRLCGKLATRFKHEKIDLVIGPAYGGIIVAHELARALNVRAIFTERKDGLMQLRRNFSIRKGERVLVAEDVVTTGKSVKELIKAIRPYGPRIVGIAALIDRSGKSSPFGKIPFKGLKKINIKVYSPGKCPLCKQKVPLVKPGSRTK